MCACVWNDRNNCIACWTCNCAVRIQQCMWRSSIRSQEIDARKNSLCQWMTLMPGCLPNKIKSLLKFTSDKLVRSHHMIKTELMETYLTRKQMIHNINYTMNIYGFILTQRDWCSTILNGFVNRIIFTNNAWIHLWVHNLIKVDKNINIWHKSK